MPFFELLATAFHRLRWPGGGRRKSRESVVVEPTACQSTLALSLSEEGCPVRPPRPLLERKPKPQSRTILDTLPREIITYIAQYLPLSSTVSFTLCCRSARDTLGTRYWKGLHGEDEQQEYMAFLSLLEKDLPDYVPCYQCRILHFGRICLPGSSTGLAARSRHERKATACHKEELLGEVFKYIHKEVTFKTLQTTMKRYRMGLDYSYHLSSLVGQTIIRRRMRDFPYQCSADARIIDGSLFLRVQYLVLIPPNRSIQSVARCFINIYPHIGIVGNAYDHEAQPPGDIDCMINHQHDLKQCIRRSGLRQCQYCPTEYEIGLEECGEVGVAAVITKWLELGEGRTVLDPRWWSHISINYTNSHVFAQATEIHGKRLEERPSVLFECGLIRRSFEEKEPLPSETFLTAQTVDRLLISAKSLK